MHCMYDKRPKKGSHKGCSCEPCQLTLQQWLAFHIPPMLPGGRALPTVLEAT